MLFNILVVGALLSSVSAVPAPVPQAGTPATTIQGYKFSVTKFKVGCFRGSKLGCTYGFDVQGEAFGSAPNRVPPFAAYCESDTGEGGAYVDCALNDSGIASRKVAAKLLPTDQSQLETVGLEVSYQFNSQDEPNTAWKLTGSARAAINIDVPSLTIDATSSEKLKI
ncbi:hypothetical protein HYFRA_00005279 [Hymenoscyphus fraxineus]|uniref:Hypersensitive response-inducing protein n=1 Tax=Hymenoscyphus fraxineus TaxID=746836 RepID=A0A9N9PW96_9HELO|nr:hypothetical protein HYFRA_00005279 [Hymenoscyphus fraxineus]